MAIALWANKERDVAIQCGKAVYSGVKLLEPSNQQHLLVVS